MRLPLRLRGNGGPGLDLCATVPEHCTVGELADAIADTLGSPPGSTLVGRWPNDDSDDPPDRRLLVSVAGPRAGSTVALVPEPDSIATDLQVASPVVLVGSDGERRRLPYGPTRWDRTVIEVTGSVEIRSTGGSDVRVNGSAVTGRTRACHGDLVRLEGRVWSIAVEGPLAPPVGRGAWIEHRSTFCPSPIPESARSPTGDRAVIELPSPPGALRKPGLPLLSATVPLLLGLGLWVMTRSLLTAAFVFFSFAFVVAAGLESRRESRAEERFRLREFDLDLAAAKERLDVDEAHQRRTLEHSTPDAASVIAWLDPAHRDHNRIWERSRDPSRQVPLVVRLGDAQIGRHTKVEMPTSGRRELRATLRTVAEDAETINGPLTVDLRRCGGLAVVGTGELPAAVARAVVMQMCLTTGPEALTVGLAVREDRGDIWSWTRWLPHCNQSGGSATTIVVRDGSDAAHVDVPNSPNAAATIPLWVGHDLTAVPHPIRAVYDTDASRLTILPPPDDDPVADAAGPPSRFSVLDVGSPEALTVDETLPAARMMAAFRSALRADPEPPRVTSLRDVLADPSCLHDPDTLRWQWELSTADLVAPIALAPGGDIIDLDLSADGPHALAAGTTGAGKSELLRTLLISLALHHPPERLSFLLIDYKGGAAFGPISALAHTVGTVTDLTPDLARRALVSLGAELRHREEWLAERGLDDLRSSGAMDHPDRPAALVIVVDEFATMAREIPDFVDGLVDVAQRGRSLGIHLVLATQRPSGVVTDPIRANTGIRIALRVTDDEDSRDVVDTIDAARLPTDAPGRAVIRLGPTRTRTVQVAHSGSRWVRRAAVSVSALDGSPLDPTAGPAWPIADEDATELAVAIRTIHQAVDTGAHRQARRPWAEPLPAHVDPALIDLSGPGVTLGLLDRPERQRREPLRLDLTTERGVAVIGAAGSGRTSTMAAVASAVGHSNPDAAVVAIGDPLALAPWVDAGVLDDAVAMNDIERVHRLLRSALTEMERRRGDLENVSAPPALVVIDGLASFDELHSEVARGAAFEMLIRLAREGPTSRCHVLVTAHRLAELPPSLAASLGARIHLRQASEDDASVADLPAAAADSSAPPGRCWYKGSVAQVVAPLPRSAVGRRREPGRAPLIHRAPTSVARATLPEPHRGPVDSFSTVAVGVDVDTLGTVALDLTHHHALIVGAARSGRTTTLDTIAGQLDALGCTTVRIDPDVDPVLAAQWIENTLTGAARRPAAILIDDLPLVLDGDPSGSVEQRVSDAVDAGRRSGVRVVISGEATALLQCYSDPLRRLRSGRNGILLGEDADGMADLLHSRVGRREDVPAAPGRGWVVSAGRTTLTQIAHS